ncbi:hypothetical protein QEN19_004274 [Hanseniaspora menglaensis]
MSFLDLETGNADLSLPISVEDEENQIIYNIITQITDVINLMNKYIQSGNLNTNFSAIDKQIFDCDDQIMIYNSTTISKENKKAVRFKLEHDLRDIVKNYEPIKTKYYNKKIKLNKKNALHNSIGTDSMYGSLSAGKEDEFLKEDQYQSLPVDDDYEYEQSRLLIQEEEQEQINQQDLDIHAISVQAHSDSVAKIQKQVTEVNQIFHNLNDLIVAQNSKVVTIEDNLNQFQTDVERSDRQLKKAERELYKRGNCTLIALVAFSIIVLLFVIIAI